jgi:hypothetical protein
VVLSRNGSECSPKPYRFGLLGRDVLNRRYWDSKTRLAAEVSKRISPVFPRVMENENGEALYENWILALFEFMSSDAAGRGTTLAGTWYTLFA